MRRSLVISVLIIALLLVVSVEPAWAQCAMCKQTLENANEAATSARSINAAIAVLFFPPVGIFIGLFVLIYRYRNRQGGVDISS